MKIYRNIFISYLCVCLIPLVLSLFTCLKLEQSVRDMMLRDQERMVDAVWTELNSTVQSSYSFGRMIAEDAVLKDLSESYNLSGKERLDQTDLSDILNAAAARNNCSNAFVYFYRSDKLVTNSRAFELGNMAAFLQPYNLNQDEFDQMLSSSRYFATPAVLGEGDNAYLVVLSYSYTEDYNERLACIGMMYPLRRISLPDGNGSYYLRDREGNFLFGNDLCQQAYVADPDGSGVISLENKDYLHFTVPSNCSGLYYGFLIERDVYMAPIQWSRLQLFLEFVLFAAVGILLSVIVSRRTFSPYKRMLALLRQGERDSGDGSFLELERSLRQLIEEQQMTQNQLSSRRQQMHNGMLSGLLTGHSRDVYILSEYIEDGEPYRVLILFFHDLEKSAYFDNVPKQQFPSAVDMLFFSVRNVLEELVLEKRSGVSLTMDGFVAMVFQSPEEDFQLRADLEKAISFMEEYLYLSVTCCVSGAWENLEDAPLGFNEALALGQQPGGGKLRMIGGDSFSGKEVWQQIRFQSRQKLYNLVKNNKLDQAGEVLNEMLSAEVPQDHSVIQLLRGQYIDMVYLFRRYAGLSEQEAADGLRRILVAPDLERMRQEVRRLFQQTHDEQKTSLLDPVGRGGWTQEVQAYIRENYADGSLNVSAIAARWNMSLNVISRKFRAAVGHSILDEIHMTRLAHAKELLKEGKTVKETAELTGYLDSRAMIQSFKRYEGITPGQIKKQ